MSKYTIESYGDQFEIVRWVSVTDGIRNGTVVHTTKDPEEAETMCEEFIIGEMAEYYHAEPEFDYV